MVEDFISEAQSCTSPGQTQAVAIRRLGEIAGFDSAIYVQLWPQIAAPASVNKEEFRSYFSLYRKHPERYRASLAPGREAAAASGGVYLDTEVYSATDRDRLPFFAEIIRPQGIRRMLVAQARFHGRVIGSIHLCRYGREAFRPKALAGVKRLLPAISLAQAAWAQKAEAVAPAGLVSRLHRLSEREQQIAVQVSQGMRNREIAEALGISEYTVRNGLSRVFDKIGASSRTELAVWIEGSGFIGGWKT